MYEQKKYNRRDFLNNGMRLGILVGLGSIGAVLANRTMSGKPVWQLDPAKCVQCGRCATSCIRQESAVKCMHVTNMCGYCDLCGGYHRPEVKNLDTAAENQLCPTSALKRKYIEEPYFEYEVIEELCIGCGKCVKGCGSFGNGSLQLQINHKLCKNCNQCAIAMVCPAEAFTRVDSNNPYLLKGYEKK